MIKLKIEKEYLENHQVKVTVEFEQETLEGFKRRAARLIAKENKIPGFRPGKAPYEVVKRSFGEEAIERQAVELMLDDVYPKVIEEADINPSGPGSLDNISSTNPPVFEFVIPLMPEVVLGDYTSIRKEYQLEPVTDEDVEEVVQNLRDNYATAVPVDRAAQEKDLVSFKIKGTLTHPEEGEDAEIVKEFSHQLKLEETSQSSWPYEDFWKELIDLAKNDTKTVTHKYSEDSSFSSFKNKEIEFEFSIENVKEMEYPEMDDEFAKSLGEYETMQELLDAIRENLENSRKEEYEQEYLISIVNQVVETSSIKYSPNTLADEINNVISRVEQDLANQNLDLETYLKFRNTDQEAFIEEEIKPIASQRLERSLVLDEIARAEGIEIEEEELKVGVTETISQLFSMPEFKRPTTTQDMRKLTDVVSFDTATRLLNQKVNDRLKTIARGEAEKTEGQEPEEVEKETQLPETEESVSEQEIVQIEDLKATESKPAEVEVEESGNHQANDEEKE